MKTMLRSYGLWSYADKGYNEPEDESSLSDAQRKRLEEERMKDAKALYLIQNAVKDTIFSRIMRANTAKEAREILQQEFQGDSKVRSIKLQSLRRDFENLRMKDNDLVKDYFSRIIEIVNQMKSYGEEISDEKIVKKILVSLNDKFDNIVTIIEETKDLSNITVEQLMGSLESHEQRKTRQSNDEDMMETALAAKFSLKPGEIKRNGSMKKVEGEDEEDSPKYKDKGGQNWISIKGEKTVFPGGGTQFIHGADQYLDQISQMIPDIKFGHNTRVVLDIGCGVASFGAFLLQRNVSTLSIAPKDVHENQIQFALERGVPAMVSVFATHRLLYPSQAFDLIHCSSFFFDVKFILLINTYLSDGILLLEVNRMLRAGGYFAWAAQPVYKHEVKLQEQWKGKNAFVFFLIISTEMENLTSRICWKLIKKEGYIALWRKPLNNSCYLNREAGAQPPLCDPKDDPDNVWYVGLKACITRIPNNGSGANVSTWPERLHHPPDRLQTIQMDAFAARKELMKAESKYWKEIIQSYISAFRWREFAAALHEFDLNCWVMNVVPVSGFNTLPVIYDRGLLGVMHDWCESFDTYPRTYDLLHASGLFSVERKKCNISTIMLEMDRILRPDGKIYVRDSISVLDELQELAAAMSWVCFLHDTGEGLHASWKILRCSKKQ
uniref:Methyltransferase n=1 Tax=Chenopodium quinoa TaxID=63459 RepID=A0A803L759_CHEQI